MYELWKSQKALTIDQHISCITRHLRSNSNVATQRFSDLKLIRMRHLAILLTNFIENGLVLLRLQIKY